VQHRECTAPQVPPHYQPHCTSTRIFVGKDSWQLSYWRQKYLPQLEGHCFVQIHSISVRNVPTNGVELRVPAFTWTRVRCLAPYLNCFWTGHADSISTPYRLCRSCQTRRASHCGSVAAMLVAVEPMKAVFRWKVNFH